LDQGGTISWITVCMAMLSMVSRLNRPGF